MDQGIFYISFQNVWISFVLEVLSCDFLTQFNNCVPPRTYLLLPSDPALIQGGLADGKILLALSVPIGFIMSNPGDKSILICYKKMVSSKIGSSFALYPCALLS